MARRNKQVNVVLGIVQLFGLALAFAFAFPQGRTLISAFGTLVFGLLILLLIAVIGFVVYRLIKKGIAPPACLNLENPSKTTPAYILNPNLSLKAGSIQSLNSPAALIDQLRSIDWFQFEKVVEVVYRKLGYLVTRKGGANPDGGVDLVLEKDGERIAVQCKQWKTWNIGVKTVREFLGAMTDGCFKRGILISLQGYTGEAKQLADKHGIEILSEPLLASLIQSAKACEDPDILAALHAPGKFCPKCESEMVLRTATKGLRSGSQFWGCSRYPGCRFTMAV